MTNVKREIYLNCAALSAAVFICGMIIIFAGENPLSVFMLFISDAFGTVTGFLYTLYYTTPLIFTGLAVGLGFRAGLFNIGAEGQLYAGAFAAAWAGITLNFLPGWLQLPCAILAAAAAGGIWGWIPGYLKGKFGSHEVITTIMMNFIAFGIVGYLITKPFHDPSDVIPQTVEISPSAQIPLIADVVKYIGIDIPRSVPLNMSFLIAIAAAVIVYILLWKTVPGYEIRASGASPEAAAAGGINVIRVTALTMAACGALAGLVALNEILGYRHRFLLNFSPGYGFTGIAIALMGRNHPFGILAAALLFGALTRGAIIIDINFENISKDIIYIFQGIIILFIAGRNYKSLFNLKQRFLKRAENV
ncbi:ABC transporter permease [candidate division KSB1 bacterium]